MPLSSGCEVVVEVVVVLRSGTLLMIAKSIGPEVDVVVVEWLRPVVLPPGAELVGVEWNGVEWNGMSRAGLEWDGDERSGLEWSGVERNGLEWSRGEWT